MEAVVEVTATKPTRAELQKGGRLKHVRFVSTPPKSGALRHLVVARLSDFDEPHDEIQRLKEAGTSFPTPLVLVATGSEPCSSGSLQLLALLMTRFGANNSAPFVSPTIEAVRRILSAHVIGAERDLIASASVEDRTLSVWSCEPKLYQCSIEEIPLLAALDAESQQAVEISKSGSRMHWERGDIDLDMDAVRQLADPVVRKSMKAQYRADVTRYGKAIQAVRKSRGLVQNEIPELSEREVRRIEKGEVLPHSDTLKKLAKAHGWTLAEYMTRLAKASKRVGR